jgi:hypothetical protein
VARKAPPVPRQNRSPKGTGSAPKPHDEKRDDVRENLSQQGRQGNIRQNARYQGYQQDR